MIQSDTPWKRGEFKIKSLNINYLYCNYSKDKFNNELTFIMPCWAVGIYYPNWLLTLHNIEDTYMELVKSGWTAEQARSILPLSLKTELYMCGFAEDWKKFFGLRDDKQHAHPQAYELAHPLHEEFIKRGYINE